MSGVVVVTGAHGFIGRYVVEELLRRGDHVVAFDHHQHALGRGWPEGVEVFLGDVMDPVAVTESIAHATGFIHLAACLGTQETIDNPLPAAQTNIVGGLNVLGAAAQYDVPGVYICVGNWWMNNTYSISKTAVERFVHMFNKERGTRVNNVRCVNAYGPRQVVAKPYGPGQVRKITPAFVCRALSGQPIEIYGDGEQVSDMVYVEDVARTLVHALAIADREGPLDYVIEAGPQESKTVNEVATAIGEESRRYTGHGYELVHLPMRPGEVPGDVVSADTSTLARAGVDWEFVSLEDGMERTVKWFAANEAKHWHRPEEA